MQPINARPLPDDRHACILWLSRSGFVPGADGSPVEAEPSPASAAARVAEGLLSSRLFPPGRHGAGMSRLQVSEICSLRHGLVVGPDMKSVIALHEAIVLVTPLADGRLPGVVADALTRFGPHDLTGATVLPVVTLADSTGEPGEALLADLRSALPGAAIADPVALLGATEDEMAPQLEPRLDELVR